MADIAASDVAVTIEKRSIEGKNRRNRVKLVFGDDALTYPAGGVPLPAYSKFGMKVRLDFLTIFDQDDSKGHFWKYDKTNNKLRCYVQGVVNGAAGAVTLDDFPVSAGDGVTGSLSMSFNNNAGAGTQRWGVLKEAATGDALEAMTMFAEAVGW
jgi:hypothetical protein